MCGFIVSEWFSRERTNSMAYHWWNCIGENRWSGFGESGTGRRVVCPCGCGNYFANFGTVWRNHVSDKFKEIMFALKCRIIGVETKEE